MEKQFNLQIALESLTLIGIGIFLMYLKVSNALGYYVRPDYHLLTFGVGIFLVIVGVCSSFSSLLYFKNPKKSWRISIPKVCALIIIIFILFVGVVTPRRALSAQLASLRGTNQNLLVGTHTNSAASSDQGSPLLQANKSESYTIADWIRLFSVDPEPDNYIGKPVSVIGFVQVNPNQTFTVSRFVITCCAVDATPIGLVVDQKVSELHSDDWVHVTGKLKVATINDKRQAVIEPSEVQKISQPADPYLY